MLNALLKTSHSVQSCVSSIQQPLLGEDPRVRGFFHGCGFNSSGMMLGGGCGYQESAFIRILVLQEVSEKVEFCFFWCSTISILETVTEICFWNTVCHITQVLFPLLHNVWLNRAHFQLAKWIADGRPDMVDMYGYDIRRYESKVPNIYLACQKEINARLREHVPSSSVIA